MRGSKTSNQAQVSEESKVKRKSGRPPMTVEQKEAAAKARAANKEKADNLRPEFFMQYQNYEMDLSSVVEAAKADFHQSKKRTLVTELKLYIKPEERMAYYVINGTSEGKVSL